MTSHPGDVLHVSSAAELIAMVPRLLGFVPRESLVVVCLEGEHNRVGLTMRFDLADITQVQPFAEMVHERVGVARAHSAFCVVFTEETPDAADLPYTGLATALVECAGEAAVAVILASASRWWSYDEPGVFHAGSTGRPIDPGAPGPTAVAAAYTLAGHGVLPDREAVVRSVGLELSTAEATAMRRLIATFRRQYAGTSRTARQQVVTVLVQRLTTRLDDPRGAMTPEDVAELAALCEDVVVRDRVLVEALDVERREHLLPVLRELVRRVPPPLDAPACAMLAWVAYSSGDGVIANVAVERSLATDPSYSLAGLIADALFRQLPPHLLEEVMREAARDLKQRDAAG